MRVARLWLVIGLAILVSGIGLPRASGEPTESVAAAPADLDSWLKWAAQSGKPHEPFHEDGALAQPAAVARVGNAGDLKKLRVEGAQGFDGKSIANALACDLVYQAAARPSGDLAELVDVLGERVLAGYQHAGYLDAKVDASYDGSSDWLVANVDEGRQYLAGTIRVVGASAIDVNDLIARIELPAPVRQWTYCRFVNATGKLYPKRSYTEELNAAGEEPAERDWKSGEPCPGDGQTLDELAEQVELHLTDMGFPFAQVRLQAAPASDESTADLVVHIESEGNPSTVDEITIKGLTRHTEQELCEHLGIRRGMPLNAAELARIHAALCSSCRFWHYAVFVRYTSIAEDRYGSGGKADFGITVEEYDQVPPLGEPLSEVDECLVRMAGWLQEYWTNESDDEFVYEGGWPLDEEARKFVGEMRIVLSRRQGCLVKFQGPLGRVDVDAAGIVSSDGFACYDWRSGKKITFEGGIAPKFNLQLAAGEVENGQRRFRLNLGTGIASAPKEGESAPRVWDAQIEPVALVDLAHRPGVTTSLADGVLVVATERWQLRIDAATGRLISWTLGDGSEKAILRVAHQEFRSAREAVENRGGNLQEMFEPDAPWVSAASFALQSALAQPRLVESPFERRVCEQALRLLQRGNANQAIQARFDQIWGPPTSVASSKTRFKIPRIKTGGDDSWIKDLAHIGPPLADSMFPRGSWPWTLVRASAFLHADKKLARDKYFAAIAPECMNALTSPDTGPFGRYAIVQLARLSVVSDRNARRLAQLSLERWETSDINNDLKLVTDKEHGLARLARALVELADDLNEPDRKLLLDSLPSPWNSLVERLFWRRATFPTESGELAVEAVLREAWQTSYQDFFRSDLRELAGPQELPALEMADDDPNSSIAR